MRKVYKSRQYSRQTVPALYKLDPYDKELLYSCRHMPKPAPATHYNHITAVEIHIQVRLNLKTELI